MATQRATLENGNASRCVHGNRCDCKRPQLGRAILASVSIQVIMALIAIASGASLVGLVACIAIGGCGWIACVAEVICFYRIGLGETAFHDPELTRANGPGAHHSSW